MFADECDASKRYQEMVYLQNQSAEVYDLKLLLCRIYEQLEAALGDGREDTRRRRVEWTQLEQYYNDNIINRNNNSLTEKTPNNAKTMEYFFETLRDIVNTYHLSARFKSDSYVEKEMITYIHAGEVSYSTGGIRAGANEKAFFVAFYNKKSGIVDVHRLVASEDTSFEDVKNALKSGNLKEGISYDDGTEINLLEMTTVMHRFAVNFARQIRKLAIAYQDRYENTISEANHAGEVAVLHMSDRSAWCNVLRILGMDDEHHTCADFLMTLIPPVLLAKTHGKMSPFYEHGWSATMLISDIDNWEDLRFSGFNVPITAEKILGTEASQALVFGLSGTMDIDSSISNYNRPELQKFLGMDQVKSLTDDPFWKKLFEDELAAKWRPYLDGKIKIHADCSNWPTNYKEDKETDRDIATMHILQKYLQHYPECAQPIAEFINKVSNWGYNRFRLITFARLAEIFIAFDLPAHLHFEKKQAENKGSDHPWSMENLKRIFHMLVNAKFNRTNKKENIELIFLTSDIFNDEEKLNEMVNNRVHGQRQYLVTAYATTGIGVNVESPKPETISDEQVEFLQFHNKDDARIKKMDIPSLYLGPITNNSVPVYGNVKSMRDVMNRYHEILHMVASYDISPAETASALRTIQSLHANTSGEKNKEAYLSLPGYQKNAEKDIHQAIGRILRGGCKSKDIYIYISDDIQAILNMKTPERILLPPETRAVYQAMSDLGRGILDDNTVYKAIYRNLIKGQDYHKRIQRIVKRDPNTAFMREDQIREYEQLKKDVVQVYSSNSLYYDNNLYSDLEIPVSSYFYAKVRDYETCIVAKDYSTVSVYTSLYYSSSVDAPEWKKQFDKKPYEVSEKLFRFDVLFKYPGLKEHFIQEHMFTSCAPGRFILCPEAVNLARGVQGEVAAKYILHKELGMVFHTTDNDGIKYERFDVSLQPDIYIDFKNYQKGDLTSQRMHMLICHAQEKAKKIQAKKVYIVNLIATENGKAEAYDTYTDNSVPIVYINGLLDTEGRCISSNLTHFLEEDYEKEKR